MTDKIKNLKKTVVIKYALVAVIVVYVALLLIFTSGSTKSFAAVEKKVEASLDTKAMKKAGVQGLKRYYGLNSADYEGVMLYTAESSISAQEICTGQNKDHGTGRRGKGSCRTAPCEQKE